MKIMRPGIPAHSTDGNPVPDVPAAINFGVPLGAYDIQIKLESDAAIRVVVGMADTIANRSWWTLEPGDCIRLRAILPDEQIVIMGFPGDTGSTASVNIVVSEV